ncbi:MAG TPA: hypothetical protein VJH65_01920 [Candidatus Nanoarchaeia archaeon]|nr:hypothetical protein [Candidatus Nanoarchaeia archaeon]
MAKKKSVKKIGKSKGAKIKKPSKKIKGRSSSKKNKNSKVKKLIILSKSRKRK